MPMKRISFLSASVASFFAILFGIFLYKSLAPTHYFHERTDLLICVNAARHLWAGEPVYRFDDLWAHTKPPFATLFFVPLIFLQESFLLHAWDFLNFAVLFYLAFVFSREAKKYFPAVNQYYLALVSMLSITNFWGYELRFGQYNLVGLLALWLAGQTEKAFVSSSLFWAAFFLKPSNLLFLPWALRKQKNPLKFFIASGLFLSGLSLIYAGFFGPSRVITDHLDWLQFMKHATDKYMMREVNFGLPLFIGYFTQASWPQHVLLILGLFFGFFWAKKKRSALETFGVLSALSVMISPMTWWATFVLLMPLSTYLCAQAFDDFRNQKVIRGIRNLVIVILGTQLIYVPTLGPLAEYPRLANPNWIYLLYILGEAFWAPASQPQTHTQTHSSKSEF